MHLTEPSAVIDMTSNDGSTALIFACQEGRLDVCQYLLEKRGREPVEAITMTTRAGATPLMFASMYNHADVCELLLRLYGDRNRCHLIQAVDHIGVSVL